MHCVIFNQDLNKYYKGHGEWSSMNNALVIANEYSADVVKDDIADKYGIDALNLVRLPYGDDEGDNFPCPFCASTKIGLGIMDFSKDKYKVAMHCDDCGCDGRAVFVCKDEFPDAGVVKATFMQRALDNWNMRYRS